MDTFFDLKPRSHRRESLDDYFFMLAFTQLLKRKIEKNFSVEDARARLNCLNEELGKKENILKSLKKGQSDFEDFKKEKEFQIQKVVWSVVKQAVRTENVTRLSRILKIKEKFVVFTNENQQILTKKIEKAELDFSQFETETEKERRELRKAILNPYDYAVKLFCENIFCDEDGKKPNKPYLPLKLWTNGMSRYSFPSVRCLWFREQHSGVYFIRLKELYPEWNILRLVNLAILLEMEFFKRRNKHPFVRERPCNPNPEKISFEYELFRTELGSLLLETEELERFSVLDTWLSKETVLDNLGSFFDSMEVCWITTYYDCMACTYKKEKRNPFKISFKPKLLEFLSNQY